MSRSMVVAMDPQHGLILLTDEETFPSQDWLDIQRKPYTKGAKWFTAYPFSGGAISVQKESLAKQFRPVHEMDIEMATEGEDFNPATPTILKIWAEMNGETS